MRVPLASLLQPGAGRGVGLAIALLFVIVRGSLRGWSRRQRRRAVESRDAFGRPRLGESSAPAASEQASEEPRS